MNIFSGIVVYVLIWWMVFFCALPFNIKSEKEKKGNMPGAPVDPGLKVKLIATTLITTVMWFGAYALITSNLISFRDIAAKMQM
jgi:predicted secreted protein